MEKNQLLRSPLPPPTPLLHPDPSRDPRKVHRTQTRSQKRIRPRAFGQRGRIRFSQARCIRTRDTLAAERERPGTGKYIIHTEGFAGCIIGARPALCMGTQRGEISRRAERRTAGPREAPATLSLARCQCPIGMRPNNRAGVTVSFQWTGNPVRIRPTIRSGPPLSPPRLGRTTASDSV